MSSFQRVFVSGVGALTLSVALAGCTVTHYENTKQPPAPAAPPAPAPPAYTPPAPTPPPATPVDPMAGWQKLGERWTKDGTNREAMPINPNGRYSAIRIKADQSAIELYELLVVFDDDSTFSPKVQHSFGQGSVSPVIDLPGRRRSIKQIEYRYRNPVSNRRAQLEVWGR
jgi:hypothetical protein